MISKSCIFAIHAPLPILFIFLFYIFHISTFAFCISSGHVCRKMAETTSSLQGAKPLGTCWASCASLEMIISYFCNSYFFVCVLTFALCISMFCIFAFWRHFLPAWSKTTGYLLGVQRPVPRVKMIISDWRCLLCNAGCSGAWRWWWWWWWWCWCWWWHCLMRWWLSQIDTAHYASKDAQLFMCMKTEMWTVDDGVFCDMVLDDECQGDCQWLIT